MSESTRAILLELAHRWLDPVTGEPKVRMRRETEEQLKQVLADDVQAHVTSSFPSSAEQ
jgi:hypothetical protein